MGTTGQLQVSLAGWPTANDDKYIPEKVCVNVKKEFAWQALYFVISGMIDKNAHTFKGRLKREKTYCQNKICAISSAPLLKSTVKVCKFIAEGVALAKNKMSKNHWIGDRKNAELDGKNHNASQQPWLKQQCNHYNSCYLRARYG